MDPANPVIKNAFVAVEGTRIASVETVRPAGEFDRVIDCAGKVMMPGFVNAHTHVPMTLMRGYGGGCDLQTWLNDFIFPAEAKWDDRSIAAATGLGLAESVCVTSGMGWYSLCGIMLTDLAGAKAGTVAFLANLLRELLSFVVIPWIAARLNHYTAIAPAGATSEDTTLAVLIRCTGEEIVVLAVVNGVLCSAAVPFLIRFLYALLG